MARSAKNPPHAKDPHRLIAPGAVVALLATLRAEAALLQKRSPAGVETSVLTSVCDDLAKAIDEAQRVDVYLTVDEMAEQLGRPRSTITRICRTHGTAAGATKVQGVWCLHWPTFSTYLTRGEANFRQEAA
jgi:hypothetical protein